MAGHAETAPLCVAHAYERLQFCERMHWTFEQYDAARGGDVAFALKVWKMESDLKKQKR